MELLELTDDDKLTFENRINKPSLFRLKLFERFQKKF